MLHTCTYLLLQLSEFFQIDNQVVDLDNFLPPSLTET
jgi:hypothetical protein